MGYDMYAVEDNAYFRYNIGGMRGARDLMDRFGMLDHRDHAAWPQPEDFGFDPKDPQAFDAVLRAFLSGDYEADDELELPEGMSEESYDGARGFVDVQEAIVEGELEPVQGIPAYKLGSNDGWLVTPSEIAASLACFEAARTVDPTSALVPAGESPDDELGYFLTFIDFLRHSQAEGFRVH